MDFNIEAITWDSERRIQRAKKIATQIINTIHIKNDYDVLEFGCGTGLISFMLCDQVQSVTCIDMAQGMIDAVNSKIQQYKLKNIRAYCQDINCTPGAVEQYDVIYTSMALHHIIDVQTTLESLYKRLKVGGYLCIIDLEEDDGTFHKWEKDFNGHNGFDQQALGKIIEKIGCCEVQSRTFYKDQKDSNGELINYTLFILTGRKKYIV